METNAANQSFIDAALLQRLVLDFAYRDRSEWARLARLFKPGAIIEVSWYHGPIEGFIAASRRMAEGGAPASKHLFGVPRIDVAGDYAIGETDIVITARLPVPGGEVDVSSWARFHDFFQRLDGRWVIDRRVGVYEKDRIDLIGDTKLGEGWSHADLARYPAAYKHLAKLLEQVGRPIVAGSIVSGSVEEAALRETAASWLARGQ